MCGLRLRDEVLLCMAYGRRCPPVCGEVLLCKAATIGWVLLLADRWIWAVARCYCEAAARYFRGTEGLR
jgi:hypothetical protein